MLYSHLHVHSASQRHNTKDRCMKDNAWRKTQEEDTGRNDAGRKTHDKDGRKTSLTTFSPLTLLQGFERVVEGLPVRGCWWPNVNFIFWPHCYDRHVVSFWFSSCWGPLHWGFSRNPSVGCGLPYHISSLCSLDVCWQLLWDPNSTELNNNSTPTRSPTGSLQSNV